MSLIFILKTFNMKHDGMTCEEAHPDLTHDDWELQEGSNTEKELDELVDYDGTMMTSKIPLGINKSNEISRSTTDDVVKTAYQKGNGFGYYYKRYWGEAYMGKSMGDNEEIDLMTGEETIDHFIDDYGLTPHKAYEKALQAGKRVDGSEKMLKDDKMRLTERSKQKMKDMIEMIVNKKNNNDGIVSSTPKNTKLDDLAKKLFAAAELEGVDPIEYVKSLRNA